MQGEKVNERDVVLNDVNVQPSPSHYHNVDK